MNVVRGAMKGKRRYEISTRYQRLSTDGFWEFRVQSDGVDSGWKGILTTRWGARHAGRKWAKWHAKGSPTPEDSKDVFYA